MDECQLGMALCATNTKCVDTERSYKCVCGKGFQGDGRAIEAGGSGCVGTYFGCVHVPIFKKN